MRRTLDTNICSYVLRRHPSAMLERFAHLPREQLWLSAIVAAELRFGAAKLASPRFSAAVEAWLAGFDVRPWPVAATAHYAQTRAALERSGTPIGGMDLLIAWLSPEFLSEPAQRVLCLADPQSANSAVRRPRRLSPEVREFVPGLAWHGDC